MLDNIGDKTFRVCSFATSRDMGLMIELPERVGVDKVGADDDCQVDVNVVELVDDPNCFLK